MKLLLLTNKFPYQPGEQFLEGEISILASKFDNVLIIPLNFTPRPTELPPRDLPENVEVFPLLHSSPRVKRGLKAQGLVQSSFQVMKAAIHGRIFSPAKVFNLCRRYLIAAAHVSLISENTNLNDYDVFYSYWGQDIGLCLDLMNRKERFTGSKIWVSRVHRYDLYAEGSGLKRLPFQKSLLKCCDLVAPCSSQGESYLIAQYPKYSQKIRHYHLGVDGQNTLNKGSVDGVLRIATCSFMVPVKRLDLLVHALMHLDRNAEWTHIGDGPEKDKISSMAEQLPPNINFVFLGHLDNQNVLEFYNTHPIDIFVNVSSSEGIPVSIMEALSFGIEPVVTDVGGISELVKPDFGILLREDFDPLELTDVLRQFRCSVERRSMAQRHQQQYFSTKNYHIYTEDLVALIKRGNIGNR